MRLLLDTHPVIWLARLDQRISNTLRKRIKDADEVFVSVIFRLGVWHLAQTAQR